MDKIPPTLTVAIWSLRSVPIIMVLGLLLNIWQGNITAANWPDLPRSMGVTAAVVIFAMLIEALVKELQGLKRWALRVAIGLSLLYVASIIFFLPGALSLWCLNYYETLAAFKQRDRS
jgi:DMSO/TMAO reductase YedYZ heme-binding membrane subunit